jgi:hypothetical protein
MEASELFVFVWAMGATGFAVYYQHLARSRGIAMVALMVGFKHVAEGKAEVTIEDGQLRVKEK